LGVEKGVALDLKIKVASFKSRRKKEDTFMCCRAIRKIHLYLLKGTVEGISNSKAFQGRASSITQWNKIKRKGTLWSSGYNAIRRVETEGRQELMQL
jgi:hypothetical protein